MVLVLMGGLAMTEEAINLVELLRDEDNCNVLDYIDDAADLIESLSAELEITEAVAAEARGLECERDQLTVELGQTATKCHQLKSQLDQVTRERDAAVEDLRNGSCSTCAFQSPCIVTGCSVRLSGRRITN